MELEAPIPGLAADMAREVSDAIGMRLAPDSTFLKAPAAVGLVECLDVRDESFMVGLTSRPAAEEARGLAGGSVTELPDDLYLHLVEAQAAPDIVGMLKGPLLLPVASSKARFLESRLCQA